MPQVRAHLGQVGAKLGHLGAILELCWAILAPSGGLGAHLSSKFEVLGAILAPSWGSWGHLGSKLGGPGTILAPSWVIMGPSWLQVGRSWGHLGSKMGGLGTILAPRWGFLGPSWGSWPETRDFHGFCGVLGGSKSLSPAGVDGEMMIFGLGGAARNSNQPFANCQRPETRKSRLDNKTEPKLQSRKCKDASQPGGPHQGGRRISYNNIS